MSLRTSFPITTKAASDLYSDINAKQDALVSGTNIKTINNSSLLGSGNISVSTFSGSYNDLSNKPTIPTVNNATLTIQKNGSTVKTFTANASSDVTANITVPTKTSDLTNDSGYTTNTGTITSVKMNGSTVSSSGEADLGTVITSHQDISGKQDKIDSSNKLSSDLVDDTNKTNKFVTTSEKSTWSGKQDAITSSNKLSYSLLSDTPTIPTVNNATLTIQKNGTTVKTFTANASSNVTANITVPTKTSDLTNDSGYTTNTGTITSVKMNGSTVSSSGEADLGTVLTSESDPVFGASAAAGITSSDITNWNGKTSNTGTVTEVKTSGAITGGTITTSGTITHSTSAGYKHIPSGGSSGQYLKYSSSGTAIWASPATSISSTSTNTTVPSSKAVYNAIEDTYLETEVSTNKTWINGERIYRKVFVKTTFADFDTGLSGVADDIIKLDVLFKQTSTNDWRSIPWLYASGTNMGGGTWAGGVYYKNSDGNIKFQVGNSLKDISKLIVIMEYTKVSS